MMDEDVKQPEGPDPIEPPRSERADEAHPSGAPDAAPPPAPVDAPRTETPVEIQRTGAPDEAPLADAPAAAQRTDAPEETRGTSAPDEAQGIEAPDEAAPSPEFGRALEDFERGHAPATRAAAKELEAGARVRGKLVSIDAQYGVVDFGGRSEGVIEVRHLHDESGAPRHVLGDTLELFVVSTGDQVVLAPVLRARPNAALQQVREAHQSGVPVSGRISGRNAGGLEVDLSGVRGFCPLSQIESGYCADPSVYVGRTIEFLVTEIRAGRRGVVVSRRALLRREEDAAAHRLLETLKPGDEREGTVTRLEAFGAFVDLGGVDGLVHVSEIRHERTGHPSQALGPGEKVRVRVLRIERGKDGRPRISLSIKAAAPDPWKDIAERFPRGSRVTGTVARLAEFGAFVNLAPGIDGLIHVSEAAPQPVAHVRDALTPGQSVEAVVLGVDEIKRRISLSIRAALDPEGAVAPRPRARSETARPRAQSEAARPRARSEEPRPSRTPPRVTEVAEETTMGIALRKAMERAREKDKKS